MASADRDFHEATGNTLRRRSTTKLLIERYEKIVDTAQDNGNLRPGELAAGSKKAASPTTKSFRQLLSSAFKREKDNKPSISTSQISAPFPVTASPRETTSPLPDLESRSLASHPPPQISPDPVHSGNIYYLHSDTTPEGAMPLPLWLKCLVTLTRDHMAIRQSLGPECSLLTRVLPLEACIDVKSVTQDQLEESERNLLPSNNDLKIFEMHFTGVGKHKFAAPCLADRATWVSAIWYVARQSVSLPY